MPSVAEMRVVDVEEDQTPEVGTRPEYLRLLEALLFASPEPLDTATLAKRMPDGIDVKAALIELQADYAMRGVNLIRIAGKWTFRTAGDLAWLMTRESTETRRLSRAAIEMLAIIAYHQPVTRAEIEEIRGVVTSKGTLDVLLETGWIKPRGRRKTPGRPLTFGTTESFLSQFSLEALGDLPGLEELKGTGLLDSRLPTGFSVPSPSDDPALREDEDPLEPGDDLALTVPIDPEETQEPTLDLDPSKPSEDDKSEDDAPDVARDADRDLAAFAEDRAEETEDTIDGAVDAEPEANREEGVEQAEDTPDAHPDSADDART